MAEPRSSSGSSRSEMVTIAPNLHPSIVSNRSAIVSFNQRSSNGERTSSNAIPSVAVGGAEQPAHAHRRMGSRQCDHFTLDCRERDVHPIGHQTSPPAHNATGQFSSPSSSHSAWQPFPGNARQIHGASSTPSCLAVSDRTSSNRCPARPCRMPQPWPRMPSWKAGPTCSKGVARCAFRVRLWHQLDRYAPFREVAASSV